MVLKSIQSNKKSSQEASTKRTSNVKIPGLGKKIEKQNTKKVSQNNKSKTKSSAAINFDKKLKVVEKHFPKGIPLSPKQFQFDLQKGQKLKDILSKSNKQIVTNVKNALKKEGVTRDKSLKSAVNKKEKASIEKDYKSKVKTILKNAEVDLSSAGRLNKFALNLLKSGRNSENVVRQESSQAKVVEECYNKIMSGDAEQFYKNSKDNETVEKAHSEIREEVSTELEGLSSEVQEIKEEHGIKTEKKQSVLTRISRGIKSVFGKENKETKDKPKEAEPSKGVDSKNVDKEGKGAGKTSEIKGKDVENILKKTLNKDELSNLKKSQVGVDKQAGSPNLPTAQNQQHGR